MTEQRDWHLSKGINIGLIIGLLINTGATIWWAATIDISVGNNEKSIVVVETEIKSLKEGYYRAATSLSNDMTNLKLGIQKDLGDIKVDIAKIKTTLDLAEITQ